MQNWERLYSYIHEYQNLVYDYYSKHAVAFLCTYWNLDKEDTVWDNVQLLGGAYERIGDLTGIKFNKYLLLPVYFTEEVTTAFDGTETGLQKDQETSIVFPSTYGITPYAGDFIKFEQQFMRNETPDNYPVFIVSGVEPGPNTDRRFWKLKVKVEQSINTDQIDNQTSETLVFFDYDKKIHTVSEASALSKMLIKSEKLKSKLVDMWDDNSGLYNV